MPDLRRGPCVAAATRTFKAGPRNQAAMKTACFPCHAAVKTRDFVANRCALKVDGGDRGMGQNHIADPSVQLEGHYDKAQL